MKILYGYAGIAVMAAVLSVSGCDRPNQGQQLPSKGFTANVTLGKQMFDANCARCHGAGGSGTDQGPPLVHAVYRPSHHADLAFHMAVKNGSVQHHWSFGNMPPIPGVSPKEVEHIIAYVRQEQRRAGIQ
jgi:mono/diheme cytochrome c family protein